MVAALAELHDNVEEPRLALLLAARTVNGVDVLLKDHPVPFALHLCHANIDVDLLLGQKRMLDIGLNAAEEEGPEDLVQLLDNSVLVVVAPAGEPSVKVLTGGEDIWGEGGGGVKIKRSAEA